MIRLLEFTTGEHRRRVVADALKILYIVEAADIHAPNKTCVVFGDGRGSCVNVLEDVETVGGNWKHALMDYENHTDTTPFQHGSHTEAKNCAGASELCPDTCPDSAKHSSGDIR